MSFLSIGSDLVAIERIAALRARFGERFLRKVFTEHERAYAAARANPAATLAKRYAAKEACFKALGTGLRRGLSWHDVAVENDTLGAPALCLSTVFQDIACQRFAVPGVRALVSLSDETHGGRGYALAFVVLTAHSAAP